MTDKQNKRRSSRKAALSGQAKAKPKGMSGAQQKAVDDLSGAMGQLNALFTSQQANSSPSTEAAVTVTPSTNPPLNPSSVQASQEAPAVDSVSRDGEAVGQQSTPTRNDQPEAHVTVDKPVELPVEPLEDKTTETEPDTRPEVNSAAREPEAQPEATKPMTTPDVTAEPSTSLATTELLKVGDTELAPSSTTGTQYASSVDEIHRLLSASEGAMYLEVNVKDVFGNKDNHRKFGIPFVKYLELLPPLPDNWEELSGITYVDQVWSDIIIKLSDDGDLDDAQARKMRETLVDIFDLGYSIQNQGQIHTPLGYLVYGEDTGKPLYVELVSGEKRVRSHYMFGREKVVMQFTDDSTSTKPTAKEEYSRKELRLAENTKSKKPDDSEILEGIRDLHEAHKLVEGAEAVNAMSDAELVRQYTSALPCTEANLVAIEEGKDVPRQLRRWVAIARHDQAAAFQRIMREAPTGIKRMESVRTLSNKKATELGIKVTPELIYAIAVTADDLEFNLLNVPEVLREKVLNISTKLEPTDEPEDDELPDSLLGERSGSAKRRAARMARDSRTTLGAYATTVMKGKNAAESRQYAFAQMLLMTLSVKGSLNKEDQDRMHRLNALRGEAISDEKLIEYRVLLVEGYQSIEDALNAMTNSSHETSLLIDRLASSGDPFNVIKEFQKEHNIDGSAK